MAGMHFKHLFIFSFFIWDSPQALGVVLMQDPQLGKVREISFLERGEHSVKPVRRRREAAGERKEEKHLGKGFRCAPDEPDLQVSWLTLLM